MAKSFALDFKEKFSFLEEYGFVFAVDPFNKERPCYKNLHGEIIMWFQRGFGKEIYVQINGWKTVINVKEEYKKYIGKSTLFKPLHVMLKELFVRKANASGYFYGLKVSKINGYNKPVDLVKIESFDNYYNPNDERRKTMLVLIPTIVFFVLFILQVILGTSLSNMKDIDNIKLCRNIVYITIIINTAFITLFLHKYINLIAKVLANAFAIIMFIALHNFDKRTILLICLSIFTISLLYFVIELIIYLIKKDKKNLFSGIVALFYPFGVSFIKSFELQKYLFFNDFDMNILILIGFVAAIICVIILFIKDKDRSNKKDYAGKVVGVFLVPILLFVLVPYLTINNINYSLDKSQGTSYTYQVVDKHTRYGGYRSGTRYYLTIYKDGKREDLNVNGYLYNKYNAGNYITLVYHEGFLNIDYFEYEE